MVVSPSKSLSGEADEPPLPLETACRQIWPPRLLQLCQYRLTRSDGPVPQGRQCNTRQLHCLCERGGYRRACVVPRCSGWLHKELRVTALRRCYIRCCRNHTRGHAPSCPSGCASCRKHHAGPVALRHWAWCLLRQRGSRASQWASGTSLST